MKKFLPAIVLLLLLISFPPLTHAHEVYVLSPNAISADVQSTSINVFSSLSTPLNIVWFFFFAFLALASLSISFRISFSKWGLAMTKRVEKLRDFAFPIIRIVFGISLIFSATHASLFGPELPISHLPGSMIWTGILFVGGILVTVGLFSRFVAVLLLILFIVASFTFHGYMATYSNYLGEIIVLLLIGSENFSLDNLLFKKTYSSLNEGKQFAIPLLRISFAISLFVAALYAKFLHPSLGLEVVTQYELTRFFPFDPLFVVFGAGCIEMTIALIFLLGINMRWNIFFFAFWATLSLVFFGEAVWPHYILFGISIGLFLYGYDSLTLESKAVKVAKKILKVS